MSLKVYNAYRLRKGVNLWTFVRDIRPKAETEIKTLLRALYETAMADVDPASDEYAAALKRTGSDPRARLNCVSETLRKRYYDQAASRQRNPWDFDVSIAFREWEGRIYMIKHCDMMMSHALDFLDADPRVKEYHYQNQSDRPDDVSAREWEERRRVWGPLTEREPWRDVLILELCSVATWWSVDPWLDMDSELRRAEERAERKAKRAGRAAARE